MKLVFAGTPAFAVAALDALHAAGHQIVGVYTQPDRPAGRGRKLNPSPVSVRASALGLPVFTPERLRGQAEQDELRALAPELIVVVAYGLILPQAVLDIPPLGCFNIHASLLPRWRGAAPIQRAIEAGDRETGVTIMRMDAGLDTGPMLLRERVAIDQHTNAAMLHDTLAALGARLIVSAIAQLTRGALTATPQPDEGATYAKKLGKEEARIDWSLPALQIARRVRAFNPAPVAWSTLDGERVRILAASADDAASNDAAAGTILSTTAGDIAVASGAGIVRLEQLQWPGGRVLPAAEIVRSRSLLQRRFT